MRRLLSGLLVLGLLAPALRADEAPPANASALLKELRDKLTGKSVAERNKILAEYGDKFIAYAEKNPKAKDTLRALMLTLQTGQGKAAAGSAPAKALAMIEKNFAKDAQIAEAAVSVGQLDVDTTEALVKAVTNDHPDKKVAARFVKGVMDMRKQMSETGAKAKDDEALRGNIERQAGKEFVERLIANAEKNKKSAEALAKTFEEKFADAVPSAPAVGKAAPEFVGKDLDGKETKLSSLKGKVVVLDIWATWCPPCRAMIPHEREMVKKLKDKPFVLVSISADEDVNTVKEFIKKEPMPWTHWWNGARGGIVADWNVEYYPTIYILDHKGVVRFKDLRDKKMEEAVEKLLKEMEDGKSSE